MKISAKNLVLVTLELGFGVVLALAAGSVNTILQGVIVVLTVGAGITTFMKGR